MIIWIDKCPPSHTYRTILPIKLFPFSRISTLSPTNNIPLSHNRSSHSMDRLLKFIAYLHRYLWFKITAPNHTKICQSLICSAHPLLSSQIALQNTLPLCYLYLNYPLSHQNNHTNNNKVRSSLPQTSHRVNTCTKRMRAPYLTNVQLTQRETVPSQWKEPPSKLLLRM